MSIELGNLSPDKDQTLVTESKSPATQTERSFTPYTGNVGVDWKSNEWAFLAGKLVNLFINLGAAFVDIGRGLAYLAGKNDGTSYWEEKKVEEFKPPSSAPDVTIDLKEAPEELARRRKKAEKAGVNWMTLSNGIKKRVGNLIKDVVGKAQALHELSVTKPVPVSINFMPQSAEELMSSVQQMKQGQYDAWNQSVGELTAQLELLTPYQSTEDSIELLQTIYASLGEGLEDGELIKALHDGTTLEGGQEILGLKQTFEKSEVLSKNVTTAIRREFLQSFAADPLSAPKTAQVTVEEFKELGIPVTEASILSSEKDVPLVQALVRQIARDGEITDHMLIDVTVGLDAMRVLGFSPESVNVEEIFREVTEEKLAVLKVKIDEGYAVLSTRNDVHRLGTELSDLNATLQNKEDELDALSTSLDAAKQVEIPKALLNKGNLSAEVIDQRVQEFKAALSSGVDLNGDVPRLEAEIEALKAEVKDKIELRDEQMTFLVQLAQAEGSQLNLVRNNSGSVTTLEDPNGYFDQEEASLHAAEARLSLLEGNLQSYSPEGVVIEDSESEDDAVQAAAKPVETWSQSAGRVANLLTGKSALVGATAVAAGSLVFDQLFNGGMLTTDAIPPDTIFSGNSTIDTTQVPGPWATGYIQP